MKLIQMDLLPNILITLIFVPTALVFPKLLMAEEKIQDESPQFINDPKESGTVFSFQKKNERTLLRLRGTGAKRNEMTEDTSPLRFELFWGQLFSPHEGLSSAYYFLSGKLDSDSIQRFNTTVGYFPLFAGGEIKLSYKVMRGELRSGIDGLDEHQGAMNKDFAKDTTEQGLGLLYKKHFDSFLREFRMIHIQPFKWLKYPAGTCLCGVRPTPRRGQLAS